MRSTVQVSEVSGAGPFWGWGPAPLEVPVRPICGAGQLDEIEPAPFILPTCATDYTDLHQALGGEGWRLRSAGGNGTAPVA